MDKLAHEVRMTHWREVVAQCQARPEGLTAKEWMQKNGVNEKQYYYWLRKIRSAAYEEMKSRNLPDTHAADQNTPAVFTEIPVPQESSFATNVVQEFRPDAVIQIGAAAISLSNSASEELIAGIIKAVDHAC